MQYKLKAVPKVIRVLVIAAAVLAVFSGMNLVYQVLRKPTELFSPVSGAFNKSPGPGVTTRRSFVSIPPLPSHPSCSPR